MTSNPVKSSEDVEIFSVTSADSLLLQEIAALEVQVERASDPDPGSTITEVRTVHYKKAATLFDSDTSDFGALYLLAFQIRQRERS